MTRIVRLLAVLAALQCWGGRPAVALELKPLTADSWQTLAPTFKDKPTIVHFWAVTCAICMVELPEWGTFAAANPGVRVVLVHWDARSDEVRIAASLSKAKLTTFENWTLADPFEEKVRFAIDRDWMGEMPRTRLISLTGEITSYSGATDFPSLTSWVTSGQYSN